MLLINAALRERVVKAITPAILEELRDLAGEAYEQSPNLTDEQRDESPLELLDIEHYHLVLFLDEYLAEYAPNYNNIFDVLHYDASDIEFAVDYLLCCMVTDLAEQYGVGLNLALWECGTPAGELDSDDTEATDDPEYAAYYLYTRMAHEGIAMGFSQDEIIDALDQSCDVFGHGPEFSITRHVAVYLGLPVNSYDVYNELYYNKLKGRVTFAQLESEATDY